MPSSLPIARSPLANVHRKAGADMETVAGWEVAIGYPSEPAADAHGLVDVSHVSAWEINGPQTGAALELLYGCEVPIRSIAEFGTRSSECGMRNAGASSGTPHSPLRTPHSAYRLTEFRAIIFGGQPVHEGVDVTGGWASLALFGPQARSILNKITAIDLREETLPPGSCCQGPVFGVGTLFGRFDNRFELHVCPDMLEFLWEVILDAGREFKLTPAGLKYFQRKHQPT